MQIREKNRKTHLDLLRILAAFLVIYNHTAGYHYYLNHMNDSCKLMACIALSAFTKINVPLFFMISGALLLNKEESYSVLFSKRILRFCLVLVGGSSLAYGSTYFLYGHDLNLRWFIHGMFACKHAEPYWFLYAYLSFLLALPLLRKIVKHLVRQDIWMLIICRVVLSDFMDIYSYVSAYLGYEPVSIYGGFASYFSMVDVLFYPVVGYYLEHQADPGMFRKKEIALLLGTMVCGITISTALTYHQGIYWTGFTQNFVSLFSSINAICVYLLVKILFCRTKSEKGHLCIQKLAGKFSGLTLGIYLMDPIFKNVFAERFFAPAGQSLYLVPVSFVYCLVSMAVCGTVTWGLKKVPGIKHIL